ncbi:MAG: glutamate--tRNA ligase [Alphaproteobacteria bacterium]
MTVTVRFAPSPTGLLHVGNVRTALINFLVARKEGGRFILRLDDTDVERSTAEFADAIREDLAWLGLEPDAVFRQSDRFEKYAAAAENLKQAGLLYPCYETAGELERKRRLQRARGLPPVYDRAALKLTEEERAALEAEGRKPHWRFKLSGEPAKWTDLVRGETVIDTASISDPILVREDGSYLYTLPSVVDDIGFGITHIVRGEDHVTNSGAQIEIFRALGGDVPQFGHHSLLVDAEGGKLSKRLGGLTIRSLREEGFEPIALTSLLARLGTSDPVEPRPSLDVLAEEFDFDKLGRAPARFDVRELKALNARVLRELPFEAVKDRLASLGVEGGADFWEAVRPNLERVEEAADLWRMVEGPVKPVIEDEAFIGEARALLPEGPLTEESWGIWTGAVKEKTGAKGKALFMPLRLALTGRAHGPEMQKLLMLIGRERAMKRLSGEAA